MRALVMSMARVTHRKLEWKETAHEEPEAEPLSWKDRLLCRGSKPPKHVMCVADPPPPPTPTPNYNQVSVCSVQRRAVVARGQGHRSWVNALCVDPPDRDTRPRTHRVARLELCLGVGVRG